jgi:type II secretion system protein N
VTSKLVTVAKYAVYPLFYFFCLAMFGYLTFPYDRLKDRLISEFHRSQTKRGQPAAQRLEIDTLDSYWFTGVEVIGARVIIAPSAEDLLASTKASSAGGTEDAAAKAKDTVINIEEGHARVRLLPLLIGRVRVDFGAKVFGGEVTGSAPVGRAAENHIEVEIDGVDLGQVEPLVAAVGLPMKGTANGKLDLVAPEGKFNKADGSFELTVTDAAVGDGKTKLKGQLALPEAKLGDLTITADAKDGVLKISKLSANGDLEVVGDGKIAMREPWNDSNVDVYLRFKFSDGYRGKNEVTRSLLGAPGSTAPALLDLADPKIKKAKRADGFYGWHVHGAIKRIKFDPSASDAPGGAGTRPARTGKDTPFSAGAKKPGAPNLTLPLGPSTAEGPQAPRPVSAPPTPQQPTPPAAAEVAPPTPPPAPAPAPAPQPAQEESPEPPPPEPAAEEAPGP